MDSLTAIALAANIYTFVEVGFKVLQQLNEIRRNGLKATQENIRLRKMTDELKLFSDKLAVDGPESLKNLAAWCKKLCEELICLLDSLILKGNNSKWESFKIVLKSVLKASKISSIKATLESYRGQLVASLLLELNERQSNFNGRLDSIKNDTRRLSDLRSNNFAQIRSDLLSVVKSCSDNALQYGSLGEQLSRLQATIISISSENRILENLRFQNLFGREDGIKNATDGTSCWLLQGKDLVLNDTDNGSNGDFQPEGSTHQQLKEKTEFTQWLKSGCGIFHISGKAGSGKSTLMKKIWMEPQTRECLKQWAGDRELLYAAFFFWNIGNDNQKSLTGLHRSILFSVLNKRPNLIPEVFPLLWNKNQTVLSVNLIKLTRPPIIEKAFETLMNKAMGGDFCLCLFIDGLDEYDADSEDHWKLAKRLRDWASHSHGNIKICVSSRPHIQFNRTFSSNRLNQHQVHLQYLNRPDIELHCRTMFTKDEDFKELNTLQENCEALTKEIVDRAEGVFLWAVLVVRIILSEARRYGTGDDLMRKLDQLPRDMERLYDRIIESLSPADRIIANRILYVVLTNPFSQEVNALSLKWLVEKHGQQTTHPNTTYTMDDAEKHITYVKNHLDGWTKGLIETNSTRHYDIPKSLRPALTIRVKFLHRTLTEYLLQPERLQQLRNSYSEINLADLHAHLRLEGLKYFVEIDPKLIKVHCKSLQDFQTSIWNYGRQIFGMKCHKSMPNEENFNSQQISWPLIEKLAKVIPSSLNVSAFQTTLTYEHGEIYPTGYDPSDQASPLHLAASLGHRKEPTVICELIPLMLLQLQVIRKCPKRDTGQISSQTGMFSP
ncbi:hypothetical protein F5Y02DRAFT_427460 [Annulohypoxylon stygium]|nr:hypothetical protein F5Y02DRAFT_427460 [Annulohypoxylon stygium]